MPVPGAIYQDCETCGDITLHEVVHGKVSGKRLDLTIRCQECRTTSHQTREDAKTSEVKVVISEGEQSHRTTLEIESDEVLLLGDELTVDGIPVQVRGIEVGTALRVDKASVEKIQTLGHRTKAAEQMAAPDEEYAVGEMVTVKGITAVIHKIKTWERVLQRGSAEARDIRRIYGKAVRGSRR